MSHPPLHGVRVAGRALLLVLALFLLLPRPVLGNARAPKVVPRGPSTAAFPAAAALNLVVLSEELTFKCQATRCDVQARYRIEAPSAVRVELSFVMPLPAPLRVTLGSGIATTRVRAVPAGVLREDELEPWQRDFDLVALPKYQATFVAPLASGENTVTVDYQQPLGKYEHGHGYLSRGRFTDYFRYELWPLSEWRRAPGFHIAGDVMIHRPAPSWWKRTFSQPLSVGCSGAGDNHELLQKGDDLHFSFRIVAPIPRRLWCHIGDEDLVVH